MAEDLSESISDPNTITIIEWADTVADILPENRTTIRITINDDGSRHVQKQETRKQETAKWKCT